MTLKRTLLAGVFMLLSACASVQDRPQDRHLTPAQLQQGAGSFLTALFSKQLETALTTSSVPFYFNHMAILSTDWELRQLFEKAFINNKPVAVEVLAFEPYPPARLEAERPRDLALLIEYGYDDSEIWQATLLLSPENGRPVQEKVLLLLDTSNGKVIGFIQ